MKRTTQQYVERAIQLLKKAVPDGITSTALRKALGVSGRQWEHVDYALCQFPIGYDNRIDDKYY